MAHANAERNWNRRQVARLAWREAKATADVHHLLGETRRAVDNPSGYFINVELGFGIDEGPSIVATMQDLDRINKAHRYQLETKRKKAKKRAKRERLTGAKLALMLEARLASLDAD
jgi:hypothetical protein